MTRCGGSGRGGRWIGSLMLAAVIVFPAGARAANKNAKPSSAAVGVPTNLNDLSLRVQALQAIYELDLSDEQLKALRAACKGTAEVRERFVAKAKPELAAALKDLHEALLKADDPARVVQLSEKVDQITDDESTEVDDAVRPTDAARAKTPDVFRTFKAGQLAAYLAEHADEVTDPVEHMTDVLDEVRGDDVDDPDGEVADAAGLVARLVAGTDVAKSKGVEAQVAVWFKEGRGLTEDAYTKRRAELEASAKKIVGDASAVKVLENWLQNEVAVLLSNPQLPGAIDAVVAARKG